MGSSQKKRPAQVTDLPVEVIFRVLKGLDNFADLTSAMLSCKTFHRSVEEDKGRVLHEMALNVFGDRIFNMALGLVTFPANCMRSRLGKQGEQHDSTAPASAVSIQQDDPSVRCSIKVWEVLDDINATPPCDDSCTAVLSHLRLWHAKRSFLYQSATTEHVEAAIKMLLTISMFIEDYANRCYKPKPPQRLPSWAHPAYTRRFEPSKLFWTLSAAEELRFCRAFLQAELLKLVFAHTGSRRLCARFLMDVPIFLAEEIRCIFEYQDRLYRLILQAVFNVHHMDWEGEKLEGDSRWIEAVNDCTGHVVRNASTDPLSAGSLCRLRSILEGDAAADLGPRLRHELLTTLLQRQSYISFNHILFYTRPKPGSKLLLERVKGVPRHQLRSVYFRNNDVDDDGDASNNISHINSNRRDESIPFDMYSIQDARRPTRDWLTYRLKHIPEGLSQVNEPKTRYRRLCGWVFWDERRYPL